MDDCGFPSFQQYLTFRLDQELFALEVGRVREVMELKSLTWTPSMPDFMRGVINLRGQVVPVVDIRAKLGLGTTDMKVETCVVISEILVNGEPTVLGVMADSLQEVIGVDSDHLVPPPHLGDRIHASGVCGIGKRDEYFFIILDFDHVFTAEEIRTPELAVPVEPGDADAGPPFPRLA